MDRAYAWHKYDHAAGYETPEPYDIPDLSDSDVVEEMQTEDRMVETLIVARTDPNFANMHEQKDAVGGLSETDDRHGDLWRRRHMPRGEPFKEELERQRHRRLRPQDMQI